MFAYCGNNPVNYCDPTGQKFSTAANHKNAVHFKSEGAKGSAFGQFMQGTSDFVQLVSGKQVLNAGHYVISTGASVAFDIVYTISKPIVFFIEALSAYDTCRFAGLGFMPSVFTSLVYSGISIWEVKTKTVREELIKGTGINFLSDIALNLLINTFMPEPSEAAQNRVQHISQRNAAVAVGGSMRFAQFTDEWRDGLSVRP